MYEKFMNLCFLYYSISFCILQEDYIQKSSEKGDLPPTGALSRSDISRDARRRISTRSDIERGTRITTRLFRNAVDILRFAQFDRSLPAIRYISLCKMRNAAKCGKKGDLPPAVAGGRNKRRLK